MVKVTVTFRTLKLYYLKKLKKYARDRKLSLTTLKQNMDSMMVMAHIQNEGHRSKVKVTKS